VAQNQYDIIIGNSICPVKSATKNKCTLNDAHWMGNVHGCDGQ